MQLGAWLGLNAPQLAQTLRRRAGVTAVAGVAPQLTADGAGAAALKAGYGPDAPALLAQRCQRHSVFWLQVLVSRSHLRTLPSVRVLHFRFETAQEITEIIGINNAMVAGKPIFADIAQAFINFVGNDKLVVHNAEFDREFLDFEFFNIDLDWPHLSKPELWIDTLAYFQEKHPGERCSLDALCERYGIQESKGTDSETVRSAKILGALYSTLTLTQSRNQN